MRLNSAISELADQLVPLRILAAIEALVAAQAVDLRAGARLGSGTRRLYDAIRTLVPHLQADREPAPDIERIVGLAFDPDLLADLAVGLEGLELPFLPRFAAVGDS